MPDAPARQHYRAGGQRDGRELFYRVGNRLMVVEVETEAPLRVSPPEEFWEEPYFGLAFGTGGRQYHVAPDQARRTDRRRDDGSESILVQNWFDELQRLAPTP